MFPRPRAMRRGHPARGRNAVNLFAYGASVPGRLARTVPAAIWRGGELAWGRSNSYM